MSEEQILKLLNVLERIATNERSNYTLIGATDWYWVMLFVAGLASLLVYIWQDLKSSNAAGHRSLESFIEFERKERVRADELEKGEREKFLAFEKEERRKETNDLWTTIERCQTECCPRRKGDRGTI